MSHHLLKALKNDSCHGQFQLEYEISAICPQMNRSKGGGEKYMLNMTDFHHNVHRVSYDACSLTDPLIFLQSILVGGTCMGGASN